MNTSEQDAAEANLRKAIEHLAAEFGACIVYETIERIVRDSARLLEERQPASHVQPRAERFSRERLSAIVLAEQRGAPATPGVLFLCVQNAGRSQMAAGWLRRLARDRVLVFSGGSEPATELHPRVVEAMLEVGIDVAAEFPKPWTKETLRAADVVVTMGCGDECPVVPGVRYLDWPVDDPAGAGDLQSVRRIRDDIEHRVRTLIAELRVAADG